MIASRIDQAVEPVARPANDVPIACSLDAQALRDRSEQWRAVVAQATSRTPVTGGVALHFDSDPDAAAELARLAAAEQACCPFLDFRLRFTQGGIELEVQSPPQARDVVRALLH